MNDGLLETVLYEKYKIHSRLAASKAAIADRIVELSIIKGAIEDPLLLKIINEEIIWLKKLADI